MVDATLVDEEHPLLLQLRASRDALARFQEEAHQSAVKLQRHSLDSARTHERAARLERENELLKNELSLLRDSDAAQSASASQTLVQELTLSLRKLSEKLTLTEDVLLEKTSSLVATETEAIKARAAQESAYELGATVRGREEAMKLREHKLQLKISTLEEQLRMSDVVLGEYAALVREMEGRGKTSTDSVLPTKLLQGRFDLQHLVDRFQAEIADALQELESTRSLLDIANAKCNGSRKGEELMLADYGRTRVELDKLRIDDGTAAKMVARYMQFSQSTTNGLLTSLETLKERHNATVSTLTSQNLSLSSQLRSLEAQNEHLRTSLDDLGGEIIREKYGRRREVALRIRMGGREERVAEGLRRWIRKGDEALARVEASRSASGISVDDTSLQIAYDGLLSTSQDARILLSGLDHGGADEDSAMSLSGSKAREIMARHGLQGLLEELRAETQRRVWLEADRWREPEPLPNGHAVQASAMLISRSTKENSTLPPLPLEDVASDEHGLFPTTSARSPNESLLNGHVDRAEELSATSLPRPPPRIDDDNGTGSSERGEDPPRNEDQTSIQFDETGNRLVPPSNSESQDEEFEQDRSPGSAGPVPDALLTHHDDGDPSLCLPDQDMPASLQMFAATPEPAAVVVLSHDEPSRSEPSERSAHSPPNANPFAAGLHLPEANASLLLQHSTQVASNPVDEQAIASEEASTDFDEPTQLVGRPSSTSSVHQQPSPAPSHPLLAELSKVSSRYDGIQRAFRDCHIALQSLKVSIGDSSSTSPSIPTEVLIAVVNRLDDYTEDARVELEIRISDEELLSKGYEALLSVPGALAQSQASDGRKDEDLTEGDVLKQIALFVDGTDPLVQKATETFARKLEDVQHDIAALKSAVFNPESLSEPDASSSSSIVPPAPTTGNGGGWTSWIRGSPSRPTTPTPGIGPSPTFGDIMTAPKLRHSSSFGPGQPVNGSTSHLPTSLQGTDRSRRSSFFGSLVGRGSDHPTKKDPLDGLSLRVPMPNFTNLGPFSPISSGPTSTGFNPPSSLVSPSFSALSPGIGTMSINGAASRSRISPPMYMVGLGSQSGKGSPAITNGMKVPFATRSFSATSLTGPPTKSQSGSELPAVADEGVE